MRLETFYLKNFGYREQKKATENECVTNFITKPLTRAMLETVEC
jgi:hypothetical protein